MAKKKSSSGEKMEVSCHKRIVGGGVPLAVKTGGGGNPSTLDREGINIRKKEVLKRGKHSRKKTKDRKV